MPPTFNKALISLIPKKDRDITDTSNFRPISLLNLDCKILTKVLALCLQQVLHSKKASVKSTLRVLNLTPRKCVYASTLFSVNLTLTLVLTFLHSAIVISTL